MAVEIIIGLSSVVFGISALILASKARQRLSEGAIRRYIDNFSVCLTFIVIFSIWRTIRDLVNINYGAAPMAEFPEYFFIIGAYIAFIISSYRVVRISHEFGFKKEGKEIRGLLAKGRKR